ncbi:MAG: precorrin-6y C5,15-methyltransferase (decarboxylating) subunit CbiE [Desulfurivibrio sp.]|nr:precorrin-6y C5,15-methyltransferase (decarboxylating) subunit CbiE [Desulfurivibrio sp.]MBU4034305.1 precorrin-6y C5,15-methyltransferase (decarboxylating) subunit CbiE [Pseudomonadota bacterium]MBU4117708.1 precorrin-6y C5,15-methyltransferase (decarboxylating) subunit CbiE [Pseudomonadota bacterium]
MRTKTGLFLIGVGCKGLTAEQDAMLTRCGLIVGDSRHLALVQEMAAEKRAISPLSSALESIRFWLATGDVGVLASGDPLFFGIGRRLIKEFGSEQMLVFPALSTMQEACARFHLPWDDMAHVSLHGRKTIHAPGLLLAREMTFVFTDRHNTPDRLAKQLLEYLELIEADTLIAGCRVHVAENLGTTEERLCIGSLREAAEQNFSELNVLIITRPRATAESAPLFGLTEEEIAHSRGLITKDEIRAVTLHALRLPSTGVLWDLGAGSGSISVAAARLHPGLTVFAVDQHPEAFVNVKRNIRDFGCYNIIPVQGEASAVVSSLPAPDRVFIGGSSGKLSAIISQSAQRLPLGGRVVVNGVIPKTVAEAPQCMAAHGLKVALTRIQIERMTFPESKPVKVLNPITVMTGSK